MENVMNDDKPAGAASGLSDVLCADQVRVVKGVWDDGEDHHPPGWLAQTGDILDVCRVYDSGKMLVSVPGRDIQFWLMPDEYVVHNAADKGPA